MEQIESTGLFQPVEKQAKERISLKLFGHLCQTLGNAKFLKQGATATSCDL